MTTESNPATKTIRRFDEIERITDRLWIGGRWRWITHARFRGWSGRTIALLLTLFVAADLAFRPRFVPIYPGAEVMEHGTPPLVTASHLLLGLAIAGVGLTLPLRANIDLRRIVWYSVIASAIAISATLSLLHSPSWKTLSYLLVLIATLTGAGCWAAATHVDRQTEVLFSTFAIGCAAVLVCVLGLNEYSWGRLTGRAGPNYWGMVAFMTLCGSLLVRSLPIRLGIIALSLTVLTLAQARGSLLATSTAVLFMAILTLRHAPVRHRGWYAAGIVVLGVAGVLVLPTVLDKLFLISDVRRGFGSGGTGREDAWRESLLAFSAHPLFGVGYRQHEQYVTAAINAHNAYIAVLTELGVIGVVPYMTLVVGGAIRIFCRSWRNASRVDRTVSAFLWGFIVLGLVEYQALALGSPMPVLMIFITAYAWSAKRSRRHQTSSLGHTD